MDKYFQKFIRGKKISEWTGRENKENHPAFLGYYSVFEQRKDLCNGDSLYNASLGGCNKLAIMLWDYCLKNHYYQYNFYENVFILVLEHRPNIILYTHFKKTFNYERKYLYIILEALVKRSKDLELERILDDYLLFYKRNDLCHTVMLDLIRYDKYGIMVKIIHLINGSSTGIHNMIRECCIYSYNNNSNKIIKLIFNNFTVEKQTILECIYKCRNPNFKQLLKEKLDEVNFKMVNGKKIYGKVY